MHLTLPVALALILLIVTYGNVRIVDPDFPWHVEIGELIRQTGTLPTREVFSHTAFGEPWIIQGWLSDVLFDVVWTSTGAPGIRLLVAVVVVVIWFVMYRTIQFYVKRSETALLLSIVGVVLIQPYVYPRPTLATILGLAITVYSLFAFRSTGRLRWLLLLPPVFAAWPNLHFGFLAGLGIIGVFIFSDALQRALPIANQDMDTGSLLGARPLFVGVLCIAALGANPHGYGVLAHTIEMSISGSGSRIGEWQAPSFSTVPGKLIYLGICAVVIARSFTRRFVGWLDIFVPVVMVAAALSAGRHLPLMGVVLMPFLARDVAAFDRKIFVFRSRSGRTVGAVATADLGARISSLVNVALVISALVATRFLVVPAADHVDAAHQLKFQPTGAADFIVEHNLDGPLFNTYNGGGYLIHRLYPWQRVFIDGRYNPYPKKVVDDYFSIVSGEPDWFQRLGNYSIEIVLTESQVPFRQLMLLRSEYRLVYDDGNFSVLVTDAEKYRRLPTVKPLVKSSRPK